MITYEYFCKENQQTVTVRHSMTEDLKTWGELCEKAEMSLGDTAAEAPVERIIFGGTLALRSGKGHPLTGSDIRTTNDECVKPVCCGGGACSHKG